jgi:hypothetical protein
MAFITIIGRGHSGTRAISHTLTASGVFMGAELNTSGDLLPPEPLYEACRVFARYVEHRGGTTWDFSRVLEKAPDPRFVSLVEEYLESVLESSSPHKGWKLPETTLIFPWIVKMFPENHYIFWYRDPRDSVLGAHLTDDLGDFGVTYEPTEDPLLRRAISWKYQAAIMRATPRPARAIRVRFEDYVLEQERVLAEVSEFLGFPLARLPVNPDAVGRWKRLQTPLDLPLLQEELELLGYSDRPIGGGR